MEQIMYRKTLDVHKNGVQFMLQGFQTADNLSRVIEISLMASGDAIDFPLEQVEAMMYVTTPNATEPSINKCTIKDNKVVYDVLPIVEEGITTMQLKILTTSPDGASGVLAAPEFAVEVSKSSADDGSAIQTTTFTALEDAMAKAKATYDERFLRMELTSDCIFKAYYADGTVYETDLLKNLFYNGNVQLSESYAHGGTGVRAGEDTDNSMYYSNVSRSEALNAKNIMENSEEILEEVKLHGMYTAFSVDFESGEVEYVSPSFKFNVNLETGQLDAEGQTYTFEDEIGRVVEEWLESIGVALSDLQRISKTHTEEISALQNTTETHTQEISNLQDTTETHTEEISAHTQEISKLHSEDEKLGIRIDTIDPLPSYLSLVGNVNVDMVSAALGKNNEDNVVGVGKALAMYAKYKDPSIDIPITFPELTRYNRLGEFSADAIEEVLGNSNLNSLLRGNPYMYKKLVIDRASNVLYSGNANIVNASTSVSPVEIITGESNATLDGYICTTLEDKPFSVYIKTPYTGYLLYKFNEAFHTNGAKYLNFYVADGYNASSSNPIEVGILNSDGTALTKSVTASEYGYYSIDVSDLTEIKIGFKVYNNRAEVNYSFGIFALNEVILSNFELI